MLDPGTMVEGYEVIRLAGSGAMCDVYEGRDAAQARRVAIKVLNEEWRSEAEICARFANEARLLASIRHPHVVSLVATGHLPSGAPFMVLEWLPHHLAGVLAQGRGALAAPAATALAIQLARGLAALHERGIVHRDLKAANVLLSDPDPALARACLADLGLAKATAEHAAGRPALEHVSTGGGARLGTWDYMAPEQWIKSKTVTPRADVYSLGVLLFLMLAGRLPFPGDDAKQLMFLHLFEEPPLGHLAGTAPPQLVALVAQMLAKSAPARPALAEVVDRLAALG